MSSVFMRFPEGKAKALTLSYDDGVEQDMQLIDIMNTYGLKGTFNINSGLYAEDGTVYPKGQIHRRMTEKQVRQTYINSGHEVAAHALTHPFLEQLPVNMVVREIIKDRENLERMFGTIVRGMAYPYGTFNDTVVSALHACGIVYSRTVISTNDFRIPTDWLRLTATCHHDSPELDNLARKFAGDKVTHSPYLLYLWGHSYEYEDNSNWSVIKEFGDLMGGRDDIWYATNIEIYEYIDDYNRLIFSAEGKKAKNPTYRDLWLECDGELFKLKAGTVTDIK